MIFIGHTQRECLTHVDDLILSAVWANKQPARPSWWCHSMMVQLALSLYLDRMAWCNVVVVFVRKCLRNVKRKCVFDLLPYVPGLVLLLGWWHFGSITHPLSTALMRRSHIFTMHSQSVSSCNTGLLKYQLLINV